MPLRSIVFMLYFCGSCTASLMVPMIGVVCYIVLYHVYPQTTWWGAALEPLGIRYSFICGVCLLVGTLLNLNRLRFGRHFVSGVEWGFTAFIFAVLVSSVMAEEWTPRSEFALDKILKVFLFVFMLSHVVVTRRRLWQLTLVFTLLALYLGYEAKNAPISAFEQNRLDGLGGPDFHESAALAIHLFALLPFVAVVFRQRSWGLKLLAFLAAGFSVNAILLCRARTAFVAGVIAGTLALWYIPKRHRRWAVSLLLIGLCGGVFLSDSYFRERMVTIFSSAEERDKSAHHRVLIWESAWRMIQGRPMGVGIGRFEFEIGHYAPPEVFIVAGTARRDAHNTYILCAAELGVVGLLAFLSIVGLAWWTLGRLGRRVRSLEDPDLLELMIFANRLSLLVYLVAGLFVSRLYTEGMWIFLTLPVCLDRAVYNEIRQQAAASVVVELPQLGWRPGVQEAVIS